MPKKPPLHIGPYQVLKIIGKGGMGEVFLVSNPSGGPNIALKKMLVGQQKNKKQKSQFLNEARLASQLKHPSIIPIYDIVDEKGLTYFTMPYIEGNTLKQVLEQAAPPSSLDFPVSKATHIFSQICHALAYAHAKGIVHRDLKPSNIIVDKDEHVKILDWGLVMHVKTKLESSSLAGTIIYLAPELILGSPPSFQSDIYSLGLILYQMLTLRYPFHREILTTYYENLEREALIDPAKVAPYRDIPLFLSKIALKCLENSPNKRYQKIDEILQELQHGMNTIGGKCKWIYFQGMTLLKKAERCPSKKMAEQILLDCLILRGTPSAPLEYLVQAIIYRRLQKPENEFESFAEAFIHFANHPLMPTLSKYLYTRLKELAKSTRTQFYPIAFVTLLFIPFGQLPVRIRNLMKRLKLQAAPPCFIDADALKTWPETVQYQALSVHLAFLLAKPHFLGKLFDDALKVIPSALPILAQILMSLIKLGAWKLAQQKLDMISQQFLDIQAIAYLQWIQVALRSIQGNLGSHISFLSEIPKKPRMQHLFPLFLILDEATRRKKTSIIYSTVEHLIRNHDLDETQLLNLDCYLMWIDLLKKNTARPNKLLQWYSNEEIKSELLQFLEACEKYLSLGTLFSLPEDHPDTFLIEKRKIYEQCSFFYYLSGNKSRENYFKKKAANTWTLEK
jgi:serine/threonine protein kinase